MIGNNGWYVAKETLHVYPQGLGASFEDLSSPVVTMSERCVYAAYRGLGMGKTHWDG